MMRVSVLVVVVTAALMGCGTAEQKKPAAPPPKAVDVLTVVPTPVRDTSDYLGSLLSRNSVTVLPQVSGYVKKIHIRPGQKVRAGDALVDIDARERTAVLDSVVAQERSAQARLELAKQTVARAEALSNEGLGSTQDLERARSDLAAAEAAVSAVAAQIAQQQVQLQFATVRAAVAGTIGEVPVRVGDAVTPSTWLTTIAQAATLELGFGVPAERARQLPPNAVVEVLDSAGNVLVSTTLFYVAPQADAVTQLVGVKAVFENTVGLRPGEFVRARLVYSEGLALQVPALAVVRQSGQAFLYVVGEKDGAVVASRKPVQLGALGAQHYVVTSGLGAGERIVVSSLQAMRDGAAIAPRTPTPTPVAATNTTPAPAATTKAP